MKKLLLLSAIVVAGNTVHAQDAVPNAAAAVFSPKRIVKTNLAGYALLVANINYE